MYHFEWKCDNNKKGARLNKYQLYYWDILNLMDALYVSCTISKSYSIVPVSLDTPDQELLFVEIEHTTHLVLSFISITSDFESTNNVS